MSLVIMSYAFEEKQKKKTQKKLELERNKRIKKIKINKQRKNSVE